MSKAIETGDTVEDFELPDETGTPANSPSCSPTARSSSSSTPPP